jgi:ribosome-associated heat shock protein Hsp15
LKNGGAPSAAANRRLDQWLWFARLVKSRSRGARLCAAGAVVVNTVTVKKANHTIRVGDTIAVPQGAFHRTLRVMGLGARRGSSAEAQLLYQETAVPVRLSELAQKWTPLLMDDEAQSDPPAGAERTRSALVAGRNSMVAVAEQPVARDGLRSARGRRERGERSRDPEGAGGDRQRR